VQLFVLSLHASPVQGNPSSHGDTVAALHPVMGSPVAGLHVSTPLQNSPSSQKAGCAKYMHPAVPMQ
jgi:hypothetical protein